MFSGAPKGATANSFDEFFGSAPSVGALLVTLNSAKDLFIIFSSLPLYYL